MNLSNNGNQKSVVIKTDENGKFIIHCPDNVLLYITFDEFELLSSNIEIVAYSKECFYDKNFRFKLSCYG